VASMNAEELSKNHTVSGLLQKRSDLLILALAADAGLKCMAFWRGKEATADHQNQLNLPNGLVVNGWRAYHRYMWHIA